MNPDDRGVIATARCPLCEWGLEVSGDSVAEVEAFIAKRAREHFRACHLEREVEVVNLGQIS